MKVYIPDLAFALFVGPHHYLELETGEIFDRPNLPEAFRNDRLRFMKLPLFTEGWMRQQFIEEKIVSGEIKEKYDVLSFPRFMLADISEQRGSIEADYIHRVHCLCEENGIEADGYCDFEMECWAKVAREWCDSRQFPYSEAFSLEDPDRSQEDVYKRIASMWGEESYESFTNKHPEVHEESSAEWLAIIRAYRER